ncbi:DUF3558 domain-containing protein [Nocardia sp. NPDC058114]|uniref:DUF3558 domain-containing protein n=1 Tax=Nocardia sp. NPDC058114 TaxID=3346346 RepID=UPI0036DDE728
MACGAFVAGCGAGESASGGPTPTTFVPPPIAVTVAAPPSQSGPGQVRLDPCTRLGDDVVTRIGFDPATRARSGGVVTAGLTTIGCDFIRNEGVDGTMIPVGLLSVRSSNRTIDEVRADKNWPVLANEVVGGRGAAVYQSPQAGRTCAIAVKSEDGVLDITLVDSSKNTSNVCDDVTAIAHSVVGILDTE